LSLPLIVAVTASSAFGYSLDSVYAGRLSNRDALALAEPGNCLSGSCPKIAKMFSKKEKDYRDPNFERFVRKSQGKSSPRRFSPSHSGGSSERTPSSERDSSSGKASSSSSGSYLPFEADESFAKVRRPKRSPSPEIAPIRERALSPGEHRLYGREALPEPCLFGVCGKPNTKINHNLPGGEYAGGSGSYSGSNGRRGPKQEQAPPRPERVGPPVKSTQQIIPGELFGRDALAEPGNCASGACTNPRTKSDRSPSPQQRHQESRPAMQQQHQQPGAAMQQQHQESGPAKQQQHQELSPSKRQQSQSRPYRSVDQAVQEALAAHRGKPPQAAPLLVHPWPKAEPGQPSPKSPELSPSSSGALLRAGSVEAALQKHREHLQRLKTGQSPSSSHVRRDAANKPSVQDLGEEIRAQQHAPEKDNPKAAFVSIRKTGNQNLEPKPNRRNLERGERTHNKNDRRNQAVDLSNLNRISPSLAQPHMLVRTPPKGSGIDPNHQHRWQKAEEKNAVTPSRPPALTYGMQKLTVNPSVNKVANEAGGYVGSPVQGLLSKHFKGAMAKPGAVPPSPSDTKRLQERYADDGDLLEALHAREADAKPATGNGAGGSDHTSTSHEGKSSGNKSPTSSKNKFAPGWTRDKDAQGTEFKPGGKNTEAPARMYIPSLPRHLGSRPSPSSDDKSSHSPTWKHDFKPNQPSYKGPEDQKKLRWRSADGDGL
ncbi:MAG: hypothetical protein LQ340_007322, partial [Diploschistes diacapsis]